MTQVEMAKDIYLEMWIFFTFGKRLAIWIGQIQSKRNAT